MANFTDQLLETMEQAAISGLCREGQLEIALQEAKRLRPNLNHDELLKWVRSVYELSIKNNRP